MPIADQLLALAKSLGQLSAREFRIIILLGVGYALAANSEAVAGWLAMPDLSPILFKAALAAMAMGLARVLVRLYFPWLDLSRIVEEATQAPIGAAVVAGATLYMLTEVFRLVAVQ